MIDPSRFSLLNVVDTCAVWNCLSSPTLFEAAAGANCSFCIVAFVHYECLLKPRKTSSPEEETLRSRLKKELQRERISRWQISVEDLEEVSGLEARKRLGKGELSSIAFAKRTRQAFLTDDQGARRLGLEVLGADFVQTSPHLLAWLIFEFRLTDQDKDAIIADHVSLGRPLQKHFETAYKEALRCRLMANSSHSPRDGESG